MPGITGIVSAGLQGERCAQRDRMLKVMNRATDLASGSCGAEGAGVCMGWAVHANASSSRNPTWNSTHDVCVILSGEDFSADPQSGPMAGSGGTHIGAGTADRVLASYDALGPRFPALLNGNLAGVVIDLRCDTVVLFNDRLGLNRVYVHEGADATYFSSEAKSLLCVVPATRRLDPIGLAEYSTCGCALDNRTLFAHIGLMPPASSWTFVRGKLRDKATYFDIGTWEGLPRLDEAEYCERLAQTFRRVVPKYFSGQARIGMSLTGGLDGRMIMAAHRLAPGSLPCYTFGGPYRECTDVSLARRVANACGQSHEVITVDDQFINGFACLAQEAIYASDGAMDVTGAVELFVNRRAREIAPIRMTGNYGSEILRSNVAFKAHSLSARLFSDETLQLGVEAAQRYETLASGRPLSLIVRNQVPWHHHSRLSVEQSQLTMRSPYLDNDVVALAFQAPQHLADSKAPALRFVSDCSDELGRIPTDRGLLFKPTPVITAAQHFYQELAFRAEYAFDYGMPPWLARATHLARPIRPENVFLGRHKFYHFRVWYRDQLGAYLKDVLLQPKALSREHIRPASLERLVDEHLAGTHNHTTQLHQALSIELIYRQLIERTWP